MSLSSPAISGIEFDKSLLTLIHEWLSLYFDGGAHVVQGVSTTFPDARYGADAAHQRQSAIVFEDMPAAQPLKEAGDGFEIRLVPQTRLERPGRKHGTHLVNALMSLHFWVSAKKPGDGESIKLAREVADKLHALLADPACRLVLAEKGITHLQPSAPVSTSSTDYAKRLVTCTASVQWEFVVTAN